MRHEEFNKAGLNLQTVWKAKHFLQSFAILNQFNKMKKACEEDEIISANCDMKCKKPPNYEAQIEKMRTAMRKNKFLCKPEVEESPRNIEGLPLNMKLTELVEVSRSYRNNNVMKIIRLNTLDKFENMKLNILYLQVQNEMDPFPPDV